MPRFKCLKFAGLGALAVVFLIATTTESRADAFNTGIFGNSKISAKGGWGESLGSEIGNSGNGSSGSGNSSLGGGNWGPGGGTDISGSAGGLPAQVIAAIRAIIQSGGLDGLDTAIRNSVMNGMGNLYLEGGSGGSGGGGTGAGNGESTGSSTSSGNEPIGSWGEGT